MIVILSSEIYMDDTLDKSNVSLDDMDSIVAFINENKERLFSQTRYAQYASIDDFCQLFNSESIDMDSIIANVDNYSRDGKEIIDYIEEI